MNYRAELSAALEAAARASEVILEHYIKFQAIADAPANITTQADRDAQEIILQYLHQAFPDDALCAEEATATLASAKRTGPRLWVVDPIDGTRGFAKKLGEFTVMIALLHDGEPVVGVVAEPGYDGITYATKGGGCWFRAADDPLTQADVTKTSDLSAAALIQSHSTQPTEPVKRLGVAHVMESYSAGLKMARVARGVVDLYVNTYAQFSDWDICAGHILVTEAGGRVTGLRGEPIVYGTPAALQTNGLLASNGHLHDAAVARWIEGEKRT